MTDNTKLPKAVQKARGILIDYKATFGSEIGKRVLRDLMANNHVFVGTFNRDPRVMAFNEGARAAIMDILSKLKTDPDEFIKHYEEQASLD